MRNQQKAEKLVRFHDGYTLDVHSVFHTLQGEGPFAGKPAVFIRLAGCNLQCPGCDTEYTKGRGLISVPALLHVVREAHSGTATKLVVITGGEPFRQPLHMLTKELLDAGYMVQIETNGTSYQALDFDRIVVMCSPKTTRLNSSLLPHISGFKYVLHADAIAEDGYPKQALGMKSPPARPPKNFDGGVYMQPYDSGDAEENKRHTAAALDSSFKTGATLCLQLHKLLNLE